MAWESEANDPQTWTYHSFSPIIKEESFFHVYVGGYDVAKFYKYSFNQKTFTEKAVPPYSLQGAISRSTGGTYLANRRLKELLIYTVATNTWTTSTALQYGGVDAYVEASVWADDDTVWVYARYNIGGTYRVKCLKYVVSTDIWTAYANYITPSTHNACAMAINTAGTVLLIGQCGASYRNYYLYTIATDTYSGGANSLPFAYYFVYSSDPQRLWYGGKLDGKVLIRRYVNADTEVLEAEVFPEDTERTRTSNLAAGVYISGGVNLCIADYMTSNPKLRSYGATDAGGDYPPGGAFFPIDTMARVSSIRHIYQPGSNRMQVGLGDLGFDIDVAEASVRRELDTAKEVEEAPPEPTVTKPPTPAPTPAPTPPPPAPPTYPDVLPFGGKLPREAPGAGVELTDYTRRIMETAAYKAAEARRKGLELGVEAVVTPSTIDVLKRKEQEAKTLAELQRITKAASATGITSYARQLLLKRAAELKQQLESLYRSR